MPALRGMPSLFIVAILSQCVVSLNDFVLQPTGNIEEHDSPLVPEAHTLNCINETLRFDGYELYPNSTLYVTKYQLYLNSTAYVYENDTITICKPKWVTVLDRFTVTFYFSLVIFMTHAQTSIALCFGSLSRLFLIFVWCMPITTLISTGLSATFPEFVEECKVTLAVLTFINVSVLGWMTFLSSNYSVRFLETRRCIELTDSKIILKKLTKVAHMGLVVGTSLSFHSFFMITCGAVKRVYDVEFVERMEGDKMLLLFAPPITLFLLLNIFLDGLNVSDFVNFPKFATGIRAYVRSQHRKYFLCYIGSIFTWFLGCYALIFNFCMSWYCFVIVNIMLPAYWLNEIFSQKYFVYDVAQDYSREEEGYTVLFKFGKKVLKLDFDYSVIENKG